MAIRRPTLLLGSQLRTIVGAEADQATRALAKSWVTAWDALSADMEAAVLEALAVAAKLGRWPAPYELNRIARLYDALGAAQRSLVALGQQAGVTITDAAGNAVKSTAEAEPNIIASQLPAAMRATAATRYAGNLNPQALQIIVARTTETITSSTRQLSADATEAMHRELIRGVAVGSNPREAAAKMVAGLEEGFNGGLARAVNIARTEILDAYRTTSQYAHQANSEVLAGWIWSCTMSARTCGSCIAMNGSVHPLSEPGPLDHQSGRCARVPQLKPWTELGINIPEPPSTVPDARKWFADQPAATQTQILGPGRLALLNSGKISWDDIPQRRVTNGWRPSYAPRSLGDLRRIAAPGRGTSLPQPTFAERIGAAATGADARAAATLSRLTTRDEMSDDELKALFDYTGFTYGEVNRPLRVGSGALSTVKDANARRQIRLIDAAMRRSPLTSDAVLYRGVGNGSATFGKYWEDNLAGAEWTEHAYLSTSSSARQAGIFSNNTAGARIRLLAPRGTHGIELTGDDSEAEVLLARGLKLRVVADSGPGTRPRTLDVEVVT